MQTTRRPAAEASQETAFVGWIDSCLANRGERRVRLEALPAAASFRRFSRVVTEQGSLVAMDAPPTRENNLQFVRLASHFRSHGIAVPEVIAADLERGFLLVTDLGDVHFRDIYGTPAEAPALEAALATLIQLQRLVPTDLVPPYTDARLGDEFELCPTWLLEGLLGMTVTAEKRALLDATRTQLVGALGAQPRCCVHRDFHSQNLLWRGQAGIGVVDFQDALWGPLCYDLASLLRDCYHRFAEADVAHWRARYLELAHAAGIQAPRDAAQFAQWLDWTALQRQIKAVGIFARLKLRDGRDRHLPDILPVLAQIITIAGNYAQLAAFAQWFDRDVRTAAERVLGDDAEHP